MEKSGNIRKQGLWLLEEYAELLMLLTHSVAGGATQGNISQDTQTQIETAPFFDLASAQLKLYIYKK
jgi:hypothetical protein